MCGYSGERGAGLTPDHQNPYIEALDKLLEDHLLMILPGVAESSAKFFCRANIDGYTEAVRSLQGLNHQGVAAFCQVIRRPVKVAE